MQKNDNKGSFCTFSLFATLMMSNWRDKSCRWDSCITYLSKSYALPKYLYPHDVYFSAGGSCDWFWWYKSLYQSILFLEWQKHIWQALLQGTFFLYPSFEDCHSDSQVWASLLFGAVWKTANMLEILAIRLKPDNPVSLNMLRKKHLQSQWKQHLIHLLWEKCIPAVVLQCLHWSQWIYIREEIYSLCYFFLYGFRYIWNLHTWGTFQTPNMAAKSDHFFSERYVI